MTDKQKRDAAVDAFAIAIKARLDEQAAKGYAGWDGDYATDTLADELHHDAGMVLAAIGMGVQWRRDRWIVDIGARAMMLHFRTSNAAGQGRREATYPEPACSQGGCQ